MQLCLCVMRYIRTFNYYYYYYYYYCSYETALCEGVTAARSKKFKISNSNSKFMFLIFACMDRRSTSWMCRWWPSVLNSSSFLCCPVTWRDSSRSKSSIPRLKIDIVGGVIRPCIYGGHRCCGILDWTLDSRSKGCRFNSNSISAWHFCHSARTLYPHCCSPPRCINVYPHQNLSYEVL